jgi:hypothetical protein
MEIQSNNHACNEKGAERNSDIRVRVETMDMVHSLNFHEGPCKIGKQWKPTRFEEVTK